MSSINPIMELETGTTYTGRRRDNSKVVSPAVDLPRPTDPKNCKPDRDPVKEWARVKRAWNGNKEAWMRYSGYKLPEGVI